MPIDQLFSGTEQDHIRKHIDWLQLGYALKKVSKGQRYGFKDMAEEYGLADRVVEEFVLFKSHEVKYLTPIDELARFFQVHRRTIIDYLKAQLAADMYREWNKGGSVQGVYGVMDAIKGSGKGHEM